MCVQTARSLIPPGPVPTGEPSSVRSVLECTGEVASRQHRPSAATAVGIFEAYALSLDT